MYKENLKRILPALLALATGVFLLATVLFDDNTFSPAADREPELTESGDTAVLPENTVVSSSTADEALTQDSLEEVADAVTAPEQGQPETDIYFLEAPPVTDYEDTVYTGSVRYVNQWKDTGNNGWGKYGYIATSECTTACISMCLSYLGINASPEKLLDYSRTTYFKSNYGFKEYLDYSDLTVSSVMPPEGRAILEEMFQRYAQSLDSRISPVMLYISGNGHNHALVVLGRETDNIFLALDPTDKGIHRISIDDDGLITTDEEQYLIRYTDNGKKAAQICGLAQWGLKD